ncbi:MAG: hypothetical protein WC758_04670 [Candidatus Woesearchaeota archaeon]|jgi:hypothetical protein
MSKEKLERTTTHKIMVIFVLALALLLSTTLIFAAPSGITITSNSTEQPVETAASSLTTAGGTFTTLTLNGTFQNPRWKAYVGNISGILTLDDSAGYSIYDWNLISISGEVYVSRNASVTWSNINCSNVANITSEDRFLNINSSSADSINKTFNTSVHRGFYVGTKQIINSSCRSVATYLNDTRQSANENAKFQEVTLSDSVNLVYAILLEDNVLGYDNSRYDFQLIVPEDETKVTPTTYYFYAEIS